MRAQCTVLALKSWVLEASFRYVGGRDRPVKSCGTFVSMIPVQEAFTRAQEYARELLGDKEYTLKELEQDSYKGRQVWRITLGFPKRRTTAPELIRLIEAGLPLEYKIILVDGVTGEPVAMKLAS